MDGTSINLGSGIFFALFSTSIVVLRKGWLWGGGEGYIVWVAVPVRWGSNEVKPTHILDSRWSPHQHGL